MLYDRLNEMYHNLDDNTKDRLLELYIIHNINYLIEEYMDVLEEEDVSYVLYGSVTDETKSRMFDMILRYKIRTDFDLDTIIEKVVLHYDELCDKTKSLVTLIND